MSVYFLRRASGEGPIKIGCSVAPECRRKQIGIDLKAEMALLATAPGGFRDEGRLHRQFADDRLEGEWFNPSTALLAAVDFTARTGKLPPTPQEDREVVFARRYLNGETLEQIAAGSGITRERVRQILRTSGVPSLGYRPNPAGQCPARRESATVIELAREGKTCGEIAETIGDSRQNVYLCLKRAGVKPLRRKRYQPKTLAAAETIARLYQDGVKTSEIARAVGLQQPSIYRLLRLKGLEPGRLHHAPALEGEAIRAAYLSGATLKEMRLRLGCHANTLRSALLQHVPEYTKEESERRRIEAVRQANIRRAADRLAA